MQIEAGNRIINLSQGVPCLPIFEQAAKAMEALLRKRMLPYSNVAGFAHVRDVAAEFVNHMYFGKGNTNADKMTFDAENVIITAGGIQACFDTLALVLESEEDVILSTLPAYSLYQSQATYFGATFDTVKTSRDNGFKLTVKELRVAFAKQEESGKCVRAVVVCTPNNPTGACMTRREAR